MNILDTIINYKKNNLDELYMKFDSIIQSDVNCKRNSLFDAIKNNSNISIIAEIKRGSPSKGKFADQLDIEKQVEIYNKFATAISVLTDENFFYGSFDDLKRIRQLTSLPILCKDFIVDKGQLKIAAAMGADVVLLIAHVLPPKDLELLIQEAHKLGLEVLVEVHTPEEFHAIKHLDFKLCGVNNRNLEDFTVSLDATKDLAQAIKTSDKLLITESGIQTVRQLKELRPHCIDAALIGESLIKDPNLLARLKIKKTPIKVKLCGIKSLKEAMHAENLAVEFIGLVFAESKRKISLNEALKIRSHIVSAKLVGVFKDQTVEEIESIYKECNLDYVQIHGPLDFSALGIPKEKIIRAIHYSQTSPIHFDNILIDGNTPGSGQSYESDHIDIQAGHKYFLAGGLTPSNVAEKLSNLDVQVADVSSGIESKGQKDVLLMKKFVETVRSV